MPRRNNIVPIDRAFKCAVKCLYTYLDYSEQCSIVHTSVTLGGGIDPDALHAFITDFLTERCESQREIDAHVRYANNKLNLLMRSSFKTPVYTAS